MKSFWCCALSAGLAWLYSVGSEAAPPVHSGLDGGGGNFGSVNQAIAHRPAGVKVRGVRHATAEERSPAAASPAAGLGHARPVRYDQTYPAPHYAGSPMPPYGAPCNNPGACPPGCHHQGHGGCCLLGCCHRETVYKPGWEPTHEHYSVYDAPKDLVYPPSQVPAAVVQYPYYTLKGPDDFFLE